MLILSVSWVKKIQFAVLIKVIEYMLNKIIIFTNFTFDSELEGIPSKVREAAEKVTRGKK